MGENRENSKSPDEVELTLTVERVCNDVEAIAHAATAVPVLHELKISIDTLKISMTEIQCLCFIENSTSTRWAHW